MSFPILATKLHTPPLRPKLVRRPRLFQPLSSALQTGHKLILVSAPAGFGKTTLLTAWLSEIDLPFAWLSLDADDNDLTRFLNYFVAALQKVYPAVGEGLRSQLQATQPPPLEAMLTSLINDLTTVARPGLIVLDDYHLIQTEAIHNTLQYLLDHQPAQLHLLITSRADPPFNLSQLRVRHQLTEIRAPDLRFNAEEATRFLEETMSITLAEEAMAALEAQTEGWVAALQLAALALKGATSTGEPAAIESQLEAFGGDHRYVIDYLAEEVLRRQPPQLRDFLQQTAILDRFNVELCDSVTGQTNSESILFQLEQANLFLIPLDARRRWYRYHHLFADFLRAQLSSKQQQALHRQAARWFEANELFTEAIKHALAASDLEDAVRVIARVAEQTFAHGQMGTLQSWLQQLPDTRIRSHSKLAAYQAWIFAFQAKYEAVQSYAAAAETALAESDKGQESFDLLALRAFVKLIQDDHEGSIRLSEAALARMDDTGNPFYQILISNLFESYDDLGHYAQATQILRDSLKRRTTPTYNAAAIAMTGNLAIRLHILGQRREALALCQQTIADVIAEEGQASPVLGFVYVALGLLHLAANELPEARQALDKTLELEKGFFLVSGAILARTALAQLQAMQGLVDLALETLQTARRVGAESGLVHVVDAVAAKIQLAQGNLVAAGQWAEQVNLDPAALPHRVSEEERFTYARVLLAQDRLAEAQDYLAKLEETAQRLGLNGRLIVIHILQALTQQKRHGLEEALDYLNKAVQYAASEAYRRPFLDEGQPVAALLPQVRQVAPAFVDGLLAAFQEPYNLLGPAFNPIDSQVAAPDSPLSPREQEVLDLIAAGLTNQAIADQLVVALSTVKKHINNIYTKLAVKSRTQAVNAARERHFIE